MNNANNLVQEKSESKPTSIFGNLSSASTTNLFSNNGTNLFTNNGPNATTGGLFGNLTSNTNTTAAGNGGGLFANLASGGNGLFNNGNQNWIHSAKKSDDEDEDGDEDHKSEDSEEKVDPSKSTGNYQYTIDFDKIVTVKIATYSESCTEIQSGR